VDLQLLWQLDNLGFGNVAKVHQRQAESRAASIEFLRIKDRVAADVAQAYAQADLAARRVKVAETGLRSAVESTEANLLALGQTKGVGATMVLLVRPQEVVSAIQALSQNYIDYYGAIADANRAQFRLYRALGQPAQYLIRDERMPTICTTAPPPSAPATHAPVETPPAAARFLEPKVVLDGAPPK
jgi:outer membrane protein TolC